MALQGSLEQLCPGDVVQTIAGNGQTGLLRLRRAGQRVLLHVTPTTVRLLDPPAVSEETLVEAFRRRSLLAQEKVAQAKAEVPAGQSVLARLRSLGVLSEATLAQMLATATEDAVLDLLTWSQGDFRFDEGAEPPPPTPVTEFALEPSSLLLRSAQRFDELQVVEGTIGSDALLLLPVGDAPAPATADDPVSVVLSQVDGRTLLDEAAARGGFGLFAARQAACTLVRAGYLRLPTAEELSAALRDRQAAGDFHAALGLGRQWRGLDRLDPAPLAALVALARQAARPEDEAESLKELGRVHMERLEPAAARDAYAKLLAKRPGDRDALEGLRSAGRAIPDAECFGAATRQLAEIAMEEGETARASVVLHELVRLAPDDLHARLLRAQALMRLADRVQAVEEVQAVVDRLPASCRRRADAEVARRCRETLVQVAPERTDLLRRLRAMIDGRTRRRPRPAILGALLLIAAGAGWVVWPASPAPILARARKAVELGDAATALELVSEIEERFPESAEAELALEIRNRLGRESAAKPRPEPTKEAVGQVVETAARASAALPRWPEPEAIAPLDELHAILVAPDGDLLRARVPAAFRAALIEAATTLRTQALERRDALDAAKTVLSRAPGDCARLRAAAAAARRALDEDWAKKAHEVALAANRVATAIADAAVIAPVSRAQTDVEGLQRAIPPGRPAADAVERACTRAEIHEAYERARLEAPRLLALGKLDEAEAAYDRLAALLDHAAAEPSCKPFLGELEQRGIRPFAEQRRKAMRSVREGLRAAAAAERAGDLASAASVYAALVLEHPGIAFDQVFTIPLRVESVPAGAAVEVNGSPAGTAPVLLRYGWAVPTVVIVSAPGFETATVAVRTSDAKPPGTLRVPLVPVARWTKPLVGVVEAAPLAVDDGVAGVVVCNRAGRVEMRSRETGEGVWVRDLKTVEGVRSRPAALPGTLWVPFLDGRMARLATRSGDLLGWVDLPGRPAGDAAALFPFVGVPTGRSVVVLGGEGVRAEVPVEGAVSAGLLAAHGAFWVGTASGSVVRVDPRTKASARVAPGGTESVTGLAASRHGVLVLSSHGRVSLVDPTGARVLWSRAGDAESTGAPAEAGGLVAAVDLVGHVRLFRAEDGSPAGETDVGAAAPHGLLEVGGQVATVLDDGRLWVYDPAAKAVSIDAALGAAANPPLCDLGEGLVAVPVAPGSLSLVPTAR